MAQVINVLTHILQENRINVNLKNRLGRLVDKCYQYTLLCSLKTSLDKELL